MQQHSKIAVVNENRLIRCWRSLMIVLNPIVHLDDKWMWRWHIADGQGHFVIRSKPFFVLEDARRDYETVRQSMTPVKG